jgi:SAM-dependent methyltransferase
MSELPRRDPLPCEEYRAVARQAWQHLAGPAGEVIESDTLRTARDIVDPDAWIPWARIASVLCVGAGGGWQAPLIASLGPSVTVVDISSRQLDKDRAAAARHGLAIECVEADMVDLEVLAGRVFDLVYQPICTCYIPDMAALYRSIASVTRVGSLYWAEHWNAGQIQLDATRTWDGQAYRVARPVGFGEPILWSSPEPVDGETVTCWHFAHSVGQLLGELCAAGFSIERIAEPGAADPDAPPNSPEHLAAYLPPFLRVLARCSPGEGQ